MARAGSGSAALGFAGEEPHKVKTLAKVYRPFRSLAPPKAGLASEASLHQSPITSHLSPLTAPFRPFHQKSGQLGFRRKRLLQTLVGAKPKSVTERSAIDHTGIGPILFEL